MVKRPGGSIKAKDNPKGDGFLKDTEDAKKMLGPSREPTRSRKASAQQIEILKEEMERPR